MEQSQPVVVMFHERNSDDRMMYLNSRISERRDEDLILTRHGEECEEKTEISLSMFGIA